MPYYVANLSFMPKLRLLLPFFHYGKCIQRVPNLCIMPNTVYALHHMLNLCIMPKVCPTKIVFYALCALSVKATALLRWHMIPMIN